MFYKRWFVIVLAALLVIGVVSAISGAGQREAWMQGYMAGRMSTGSDGGADLTPYMLPGGPLGPRYGGFGPGPGLFIGLAFLALGAFLIGRRMYGTRPGDPHSDWHAHMRDEARRWHQRHHGRWDAESGRAAAGDEQQMI